MQVWLYGLYLSLAAQGTGTTVVSIVAGITTMLVRERYSATV